MVIFYCIIQYKVALYYAASLPALKLFNFPAINCIFPSICGPCLMSVQVNGGGIRKPHFLEARCCVKWLAHWVFVAPAWKVFPDWSLWAPWVTVEAHAQAWSFSGCEQCLVFISLTCGGLEAAGPALTYGCYGYVLVTAQLSACYTNLSPATRWVLWLFFVCYVHSWCDIGFSIESRVDLIQDDMTLSV